MNAPDRDPLASWTEGPAKQQILAVVDAMTDPASSSFVEERRRIATFDNDGTLWCEKPVYVQFMLLLSRWQQMAADNPALRETQPYKAAAEGDRAWFSDVYAHVGDLLKGAGEAFAGLTPDEFDAAVAAFFRAARHPRFGVPLDQLTYTPMVELVQLFRDRGFSVLVTTGGGRDFVRVVAEQIYGLPRGAVIGSAPELEYRDGGLVRTDRLSGQIDDGPGKPVHIYERTGYLPAIAVGNADGDIQMLESAQFGLLLHHDDDAREYAYDSGSQDALARAQTQDWLVVSMKDDFAEVFAAGG